MAFGTGTFVCLLSGHAPVEHPVGNGQVVEMCRHCHKVLREPDQMRSRETTPQLRGYEAAAAEHFGGMKR